MEEKVVVRQAYLNELEEIREFISQEWKLSVKYYQQFHVAFDKLWFVIGKGEISDEIYGACGIIITNEGKGKDAQLVLLYGNKSSNDFSSISLLKYISEDMGFRSVSSCGVRKNVIPLYKWLGYSSGKMNHYYKIGYVSDFKIADIDEVKRSEYKKGHNSLELITEAIELENFDFKRYKENVPRKDMWCVKHRYFDESKHNYNVYKVLDEEKKWNSIIVMREVEALGSKSCKIVDFIGEDKDISELGEAFDILMKSKGYEFLDFYNIGIDGEYLTAAGFLLHDKDDKNVIPHFSEPVLKENKDIFYISNTDGMHLYVGDADQDRSVYGYMEK